MVDCCLRDDNLIFVCGIKRSCKGLQLRYEMILPSNNGFKLIMMIHWQWQHQPDVKTGHIWLPNALRQHVAHRQSNRWLYIDLPAVRRSVLSILSRTNWQRQRETEENVFRGIEETIKRIISKRPDFHTSSQTTLSMSQQIQVEDGAWRKVGQGER